MLPQAAVKSLAESSTMMLLSTCSECEGGRSARREEEGQVRGEMTEVQHLEREREGRDAKGEGEGTRTVSHTCSTSCEWLGSVWVGVWISEDE